jgi:hypothetical protein
MAFNKLTIYFADKTKQIINFYNQKVDKISNEPVYVGTIPIGGEPVKVASTFGKGNVEDLSAELLVNEDCQIAIIVNPDSNEVNFRKRNNCKVNLENLAKKLCEGSGSKKAATGKITESFLNFTKLLAKK